MVENKNLLCDNMRVRCDDTKRGENNKSNFANIKNFFNNIIHCSIESAHKKKPR